MSATAADTDASCAQIHDLSHAAASKGVSLAAIAVLTAYAWRTDENGVARASLREIARDLHRSPGVIQRYVNELSELGLMEQLGRCRADNRRRLWQIAGMGGGPP